jgi:hypothetical protein
LMEGGTPTVVVHSSDHRNPLNKGRAAVLTVS